MAGFGVVWAAIVVIVFTPFIGLDHKNFHKILINVKIGALLTKIAFILSENHVIMRRKERKDASIAKESSLSSDFISKISKSRTTDKVTIRSNVLSKRSAISKRGKKSQIIQIKIKEIEEQLSIYYMLLFKIDFNPNIFTEKLNKKFDKRFGGK